MSFNIKRIIKVNNDKMPYIPYTDSYKIGALDTTGSTCPTGGTGTSTATSYLYPNLDLLNGCTIGIIDPTTGKVRLPVANPSPGISPVNIDPDGNYIYTIGWFAKNVAQGGPQRNTSGYVAVTFDSNIPKFPPPAQIAGTSGPTGPNNYYFGYICADGELVYDITSCKCPNGTGPSPLNLGVCTSASGATGPTPYDPVATIQILTDGYYRIQFILDTFSPTCPATKDSDGITYRYIPQMFINVFNDSTAIGKDVYTTITTNFDKQLIGTSSFYLEGNDWKVWYPNPSSNYSLVAPIPQPTNSGTDFYNTWPLYKGNILQFMINNTCKGTGYGADPGNFSGTIRLTPQTQ